MNGIERAEDRWENLKARLGRSSFRARFVLAKSDLAYIQARGYETIREHAARFVAERLAAAAPHNDGHQTPMRGHPVFVAQHATATCCRKCLKKWHWIAEGAPLTSAQQVYVVDVIVRWIAEKSFARLPADATALWKAPYPRAVSRTDGPVNRDLPLDGG